MYESVKEKIGGVVKFHGYSQDFNAMCNILLIIEMAAFFMVALPL